MSAPLRPDELAAESEIGRSQKIDHYLKTGAKTALSLAAGSAGLSLASKITPFLNSYIPAHLAIKGISKISPNLGEFLKAGIGSGLEPKEGLAYIKKQIDTEEGSNKAKQDRNIIQQYSPELFEFLKGEIQKGRPALEAGAIAQTQNKFKNIIKKIAEDHKTPFASILQTVFGQGEGQAQQQGQSELAKEVMNPPGSMPTRAPSAESQAFTQAQQPGQGQQNQQGVNGVDPQLAQMIQQGNQILKNFRGR